MTLRTSILCAALCAGSGLTACASNSFKGQADSATNVADTGAGESGDQDSSPPPEPSWFTPRAVIDVAAGVPTLSQLSILVVDVDMTTVVCELAQDATLAVAEVPPDDTVSVWLVETLTPGDADCAELPSPIGIGIGVLPADVRAQLGPSGLDDVADSLFGAYVRAPESESEDLAAFGYAGTPDDLAGDDAATLPAPDGQYVLNPLFLLKLSTAG
jgi:hypothetical protein